MNLTSNIDKGHQIDLIVWGALLLLFAILGFGRAIMFLFGVALVVQGILNFSVIPFVMNKLNIKI